METEPIFSQPARHRVPGILDLKGFGEPQSLSFAEGKPLFNRGWGVDPECLVSPSGRHAAFVAEHDGWGQAHVVDRATGTLLYRTQGCREHGSTAGGAPLLAFGKEGELLTAPTAGAIQQVMAIDWRRGGERPIAALAPYTEIKGLVADTQTGCVGLVGAAATLSPRALLWDPNAQRLTELADPAATGKVHECGPWSRPEFLSWSAPDGLEIHGLYYQAQPTPTQPPPLIVLMHDGPHRQVRATWPVKAHFFNARGYAVLYVNYRGSTGYGRSYANALKDPWQAVVDVIAGTDTLCQSGKADPRRLILWGGGWAGARVLEALSEADSPFLGGISVYPDLHDTTPIPAPHHRVLLVQGAKDLTAPLARAHSFAERAWSAGAALRLKVYEGEGHGWQAAETLVDYYEEVHKFTSGV